MKIDYLVTGLDVGGAEVQVRDLAIGMKRRGHDVSVTSLLQPNAYVDQLAAAGVFVTTLSLARGRRNIVALLRAAKRYRLQVQARGPDVVHAHMVHANLLARVALAFSGLPVVCTIHSMDEGGRGRDVAYALTNWAAALNTTISDAATKRFTMAKALPKNTVTIYNGVDTLCYAPASTSVRSSEVFRWIAVGRLEPAKDYPTLLRAMAHLPDAVLDIAGSGRMKPYLEDLSHELGVQRRVTFLGVRNNISELLRRYDGYVLSSRQEGFGIAIVEAMASGLPVVVTDAGGPPEIVGTDGSTGLVVPPGDDQALANAMRAVASLSPSALASMGERGRARAVRLFDLSVALQRWEEVYRHLSS